MINLPKHPPIPEPTDPAVADELTRSRELRDGLMALIYQLIEMEDPTMAAAIMANALADRLHAAGFDPT